MEISMGDMDDIFNKRQSILIANVNLNGKHADLFVNNEGIISAAGEGVRVQYKGEADLVIDGDGAIALPSLANTHTHAAMSLLRGYADDMILQDWLSQKIWPL
jgi:5-methylthioadenosine/S-adenosylhomocysteine deaminase